MKEKICVCILEAVRVVEYFDYIARNVGVLKYDSQ